MSQTVNQALTQMKLYTDGVDYHLLKLHPRAIILAAGIVAEIADPFSALLVDKDEVTLLIPGTMVEEFEDRLRDCQISNVVYRLITLDVELDLQLVGFMAHISSALAEAGVPILVYAAFSRDHLFVPVEKLELAIVTLEKLKT